MIKLKDLLLERSLSEEMRELKFYIDNDAIIYRQRYMPILKNLSRKKKQGKYRKGLASKAFMYMINSLTKWIRKLEDLKHEIMMGKDK